MKHFSKISNRPTDPNRKIKTLNSDPNQNHPFSIEETTSVIKTLKRSRATGPDNISNYHLKHLGQNAIKALTDIFNHSWLHNDIPNFWKNANIITILKPNKPPTNPSSYRPISLLSTISKVLELSLIHI